MSEFVGWLFSPAGAGWVFGFVALFVAIFQWVQRKRARRLIFRQIDTTSLVDINPRIRDKIKVTFNDKLIVNLTRFRAEIFSLGSDSTQNPTITITVPEETRILDVAVVSSTDGCEPSAQVGAHSAVISVPYINPYRDHKHTLLLSIVADGSMEDAHASGGGEGWSLREAREKKFAKLLRLAIAAIFILFMVVYLMNWYFDIIETNYGISRQEISFRSFVAAVPFAALMIVFFYVLNLATRRRPPRTSKATFDKIRNA